MYGWPEEFCQPNCVFENIRPVDDALLALVFDCRRTIAGMGGATTELNVETLKWKLEVNDIPKELWPDVDDYVSVMFDELQTCIGKKSLIFDEEDLQLMRDGTKGNGDKD